MNWEGSGLTNEMSSTFLELTKKLLPLGHNLLAKLEYLVHLVAALSVKSGMDYRFVNYAE